MSGAVLVIRLTPESRLGDQPGIDLEIVYGIELSPEPEPVTMIEGVARIVVMFVELCRVVIIDPTPQISPEIEPLCRFVLG